MRHRDPHDDPPARRRNEPYRPPVTLGHIRSHGVRRLLIYCSEGLYCHHSAVGRTKLCFWTWIGGRSAPNAA
jgi:hypothetical protein